MAPRPALPSLSLVTVLVITAAACAGRNDIDRASIGSEVQVTRDDGGVVQGTLTARDDHNLRMAVGPATRSIARDEIDSVQVVDGTTPPLPPAARFRELALPAGTRLTARLDTTVGSDVNRLDDAVEATLTQAVVVNGVELLPAGSILAGVVTTAVPAGKVSGRARLAIHFRSVAVPDQAERYDLSADFDRTAPSSKGDDARTIGIPAAGGAILGAILDGKKGAAVGTAIGGGAGAAVVLATAGDEVTLPRGTIFSVALDRALDVRVPLARMPQP